MRRTLAAALFVAALLPVAALAQEKFLLDEYNVEAFGAADSTRIAAGLTFGTVYASGMWWNVGPRISWVRWNVDMPRQDGFGVGGVFGGGWRPDRTVSPYASLGIDRVFNVSDRFEWQSTVLAGARVKVTPGDREYFAMTFALYQSSVFGGDGPEGDDYGIAVLYSAALFAKRK
jgi:hypothetical protein